MVEKTTRGNGVQVMGLLPGKVGPHGTANPTRRNRADGPKAPAGQSRKTAILLTPVVMALAAAVGLPASAVAAFTARTSASLTSSTASLGKPATGTTTVSVVCTGSGSGANRSYLNTVTVAPFEAVPDATAYRLILRNAAGVDVDNAPAQPSAGGTVTATLTQNSATIGWTAVFQATRTFPAVTWHSFSAAQSVPVSNSC